MRNNIRLLQYFKKQSDNYNPLGIKSITPLEETTVHSPLGAQLNNYNHSGNSQSITILQKISQTITVLRGAQSNNYNPSSNTGCYNSSGDKLNMYSASEITVKQLQSFKNTGNYNSSGNTSDNYAVGYAVDKYNSSRNTSHYNPSADKSNS